MTESINNALIIPEPSELKISTMTCLCLLNTEIDLDILSRFVKVYSKDDEIITKGNGGIVYVEYFMLLPRGQYCGKKAQIKKKELQNNSKIRKMFDSDDNYKDCYLGDINYQEPDPTKSKKRKKKIIKKRQFENQATLIFHFNNDRYVNIKVFNNGKIQMTGVRSKEEAHTVIYRLIDIIKETKITQLEWENVIKTTDPIKNEYVYTKTDNQSKVFRYIMIDGISKWVETEDDCGDKLIVNKTVIPDNSKIKLTNFETVMINSNYTVGFNIDRAKLHQLLKRKYNIYATLESTYQAVKSYYFFKKSKNSDEIISQNGVCKCEIPCFVIKEQQKDVVPPCTQVTIAVFRTGSIIITGGCTIEQTNEAYNFINSVIKDNFNLIYQIQDKETPKTATLNENDPISKIKLMMIERANENRRRTKKKAETKTPTSTKAKKDPSVPVVKGKRGRKPKILSVNINEIIDSPYQSTAKNDAQVEVKQVVKEKKERKKYEKKPKKTVSDVDTKVN
jgi:TATA-box binding protein (TBP) (component of TFIID and TFIIIB)